jgi:hypothetical protein
MAGGWESSFGGTMTPGSGWQSNSTQPPSPADIVTWWDFSDLTTMFTDDEGTVPVASDEDPVRNVTNKGSDSITLVTGAASTDVVYNTGFQNSLGGLFSDAVNTDLIGDLVADLPGTSLTVLTVYSVALSDETFHLFYFVDETQGNRSWGSSNQFNYFTPNIDSGAFDTEAVTVDATPTAGLWHFNLADGFESDPAVELSTTVEHTNTFAPYEPSEDTYTRTLPTAGSEVSIAQGNLGQWIGEIIVWSGEPVLADIQQYVSNKWALTFDAGP